MRGRPRTPTKIKLIKGNPGQRPLNDREPQPLRTIPECPPRLTEEEREVWGVVSRKLYDMGVLTEVDDIALSVFCEYFSEYSRLAEMVKKTSGFIKAKSGRETKTMLNPDTGEKIETLVDNFVLQRSPVAIARDAAWSVAARIMADFGMNPAARSRLKIELERKTTDSYEEFRHGKRKA